MGFMLDGQIKFAPQHLVLSEVFNADHSGHAV
jgi:hypothetical protein